MLRIFLITVAIAWLNAVGIGWAVTAEPTIADLPYAKVGDRTLRLDLYQPTGPTASAAPTVVWIHGGAWRAGSKENVPVLKWRDRGFAIASIDYRLSPEASFPAQVHDIKAAIRFLRSRAAQWNLDPDRFIISGASAGGHLAALVGVTRGVEKLEGSLGDHRSQSSHISAIVSFYGASNLRSILSQSTEHGLSVRVPALQLLLGGRPEEVPELAKLASPVEHVDAKDPPLWLIHGNADPQMPPEQSEELQAAYQRVSAPVKLDVIDGGKHGGAEFYTPQRLDRIADEVLNSLGVKSRTDDPNTETANDPLRILFAGSSSTYWNDMPNEIAKVISQQGGLVEQRRVVADLVGRSGSDIRVYLDPKCNYQYGVKPGQSFLEKVRDEKFDYVVLMCVCQFIMGDGEENADGRAHRDAITKYCQAIREAGSEPVFYEMGWGTTDREARGRERILELARQNEINVYAPCSTAWARVRSERPDLKLQHPGDKSHPGDLGHFLNMACFYSAFVGHSPEGHLPRNYHVWPHLSKVEKERLREELEASFAAFQPDAYQARLPEWMRRNAGAGYRGSITEEDAKYLERVAWETWLTTTEKLKRPRTD